MSLVEHKLEVIGINSEVVAVTEQLVFWHRVGDVTTPFNLSITVISLGVDN